MQLSFVTALSLVAAAAAAPAHMTMNMMKLKEAIASNYTWTVLDWQAGCATSSNCSYSFQVSGAASGASIPSFNASCSGSGIGAAYKECTGPDRGQGQIVSAKLQAANNTDAAHLAVSYRFDDASSEGVYWNYTSYATEPWSTQTGLSFRVQPSEIWGAA